MRRLPHVQYRIQSAADSDLDHIQQLYTRMRRPTRAVLRAEEYLVASVGDRFVGCAGAHLVDGAGYLYGLAVMPEFQKQGMGSALTLGRVERVASAGGKFAVALAMFWNLRFFRKLGFDLIRRVDLPAAVSDLADFRSPQLKRSCIFAL